MARKRIFIHIGLPKTGSSALQAYLSFNAAALAGRGVFYPYPEAAATIDSGACTGNLLHVIQSLALGAGLAGDIELLAETFLPQIVEKAIAESPSGTILFSGEFLVQTATPAVIDLWRRLAEEHDLTVIAFVRDAYAQCVSAWKHYVKAVAQDLDLAGFIEDRGRSGRLPMQRLQPFLESGLDVRLASYDVHRTDLFAAFLRLVGLPGEAGLTPLENPVKNPSITYWQAHSAVLVQNYVGSSRLTASMLGRFRGMADPRPDPYIPAIDSRILELLGGLVARANALLPPAERLRDTPLSQPGTPPALADGDVIAILSTIAEFIADQRLIETAADTPGLPEGFDPDEYLLRNPDVEAAGMDPVLHYLNHGRFEGRPVSARLVGTRGP